MPTRTTGLSPPSPLLVLLLIITSSASRLGRRNLPQVFFKVEENTEQGQIVGSIYDKINLPLDQRFQYSLPQNPFFKFDTEGSLIVAGELDRDDNPTLCKEPGFPEICEWSSFLIGTTGSYIPLRVHITDVNDNAPTWPVDYVSVTIPENSPPNFTTELSTAQDADFGINGIREYKLIVSPEFENAFMLIINPFQSRTTKQQRQTKDRPSQSSTDSNTVGSPVLVLLKPLDREKVPWINLTLLAVDGSPPYHTGALEIYIKVSDDNDHAPVFTFQRYVAQLTEIAPVGSSIKLQPISSSKQSDDNGVSGPLVDGFQAEDLDEGANGRILYSFARSTPLETQKTFSIDSHTGQLRVARPLSYDDGPISWSFQVVATDNGRPPRSSFTDVSIQLKDANNHPPTITVQAGVSNQEGDSFPHTTTVRIPENVRLDKKHLATVTVNDRDTEEGGEFDCALQSQESGYFELVLKGQLPNVVIYDLLVSGTFDREEGKVRLLGIFCEDQGSPRLTSNHAVRVIIEDENDNSPVFEFPFYHLTTKEGQPKGTVVGQVKATDPDDGESARLFYEIRWPRGTLETDKVIAIGRDGDLTVKVPLDRERAPYGYNLTVICRDNGSPSRSASAGVHVDLLDVNDCIPVFSRPVYNFTTVEDYSNSFQGQRLIGQIQATDCDGPDFNRLSFRLLNSYHLFSIDNEGRIFTTGILDREQEPFYELLVLATDGPIGNDASNDRSYNPEALLMSSQYNTATVTVRVFVDDLNDNPPNFVHPDNTSTPIRVSYQEESSFVLTRMVAIDPDNEDNGTVSYRITKGNRLGIFKLGEYSGDLYISKKMTAELVGAHALRIEARDHGPRPLTSQTDIVIRVDDSSPVGLHNDFLLGLGPNDGPLGGHASSLGLSLLGSETMMIVYVIVGVVFVCLSLLVASVVFCRRLRSRQDRQRLRQWSHRHHQQNQHRRHQQQHHHSTGLWSNGDQKVNGFVEVNSNTQDCYQKSLDGHSAGDLDCMDCDGSESSSLKPNGAGRQDYQHLPLHLPESSCYTIRMTSLSRPPRTLVGGGGGGGGGGDATTGPPNTTFAYLIPSSGNGGLSSATAGGIPVSSGHGGEFLLVSQSPVSSPDGQPVSKSINHLVGCPSNLGNSHSATELITLPISTEALVRTEIWTNDPRSSEAYVTLKPYCQLDGCLQNLHFVDAGEMAASKTAGAVPTTSAGAEAPSNCLFLQNQNSLDSDATSPPGLSISILDPLTGKRIFIPPFTATTGFLIPNNTSYSKAGVLDVSKEPSSPSKAKDEETSSEDGGGDEKHGDSPGSQPRKT